MKSVSSLLLCVTLVATTQCFFDRSSITSSRRRLQTVSPEDPSNTEFINMKVPSSIYELSSPVDYLTQGGSGTGASGAGILQIDALNHDANYIKIADDLKRYEDAYSSCINALSDNDFSDETVDNCVGINYNYVYDDCDYEKSKILARADSALRDFMIQNCYTVAGVDLVLSNACDLVETDALTLLWNELNFAALMDYHRNKYIFEYAYMNETMFNAIQAEFAAIYKETNSLLTELYDHRTLTVSHLEDLISRRTSEIMDKYHDQAGYTTSSSTSTTHIIIETAASGDDDEYWRKRHRNLGDKNRAGKGYKAPMARFLELNPKNLKVREQKLQSSEVKQTKQSGGKIAVDLDQKKDV